MQEQDNKKPKSQRHLQSLDEALETGALFQARLMLNNLHPAEIAHLLESLPREKRDIIWKMVDQEYEGDILLEVNDEVRSSLIRDMEDEELLAATEGLDMDDLADILQDLPDAVIKQTVASMDEQNRQRLEAVLSYPEDTAGGLMNTDVITVRKNVTLDVVLRYLRLRGDIPKTTDSLFVVDRFNRYLGTILLTELLTQDPDLSVDHIMNTEVEGIPATTPDREVTSTFEHRNLVSAPVVDDEGKLIGRITIDDVVDVIRDEGEHSLMSMVGLNEEVDMFAPVLSSTQKRFPWLGANLITAFIASWVIFLFDATIEKLVALAILMPIVASMGGIAGSQTLTLVIRGMALGQIGYPNASRLLIKELGVGFLNGALWAAVIGLVTYFWFQDYRLGLIIGAAIIINLVTAAIAGTVIPLLIRKLGADPALGGTVVLTTITDVIGFMAFLGLATAFLM